MLFSPNSLSCSRRRRTVARAVDHAPWTEHEGSGMAHTHTHKFSGERMLFRENFFGLSGQEVPMDWLHQSEAKYPSSCQRGRKKRSPLPCLEGNWTVRDWCTGSCCQARCCDKRCCWELKAHSQVSSQSVGQ